MLKSFSSILEAVPAVGRDPQVLAALRSFLVPQRAAAQAAEQALLGNARATRVAACGFDVPAWTWGEGPQVLLVHGWSSRTSHLGAFVVPLVEAGFTVTGFDSPAHGDAPGDASSMVHMGRAVRDVARALGMVHALIAHSVGSPASLWAMRDGLQVRTSIHLAGPGSLANVVSGFARGFTLDAEQADLFQRGIEAFSGESIERGSAAALAAGASHQGLLVHDSEDREIPAAESVEVNRHWRESVLRLTHGLGHRRLLTDPEVIRQAVQFVTQAR